MGEQTVTEPRVAGARAQDAPMPEPGAVIADRFVVERQIGEGGMGVVFAAIDRRRGDTVAIKVLRHAHADRNALKRFLREAQLTAKLASEHVVRMRDYGRLPGGAPFIAMDYLEGSTLERLLREGGPLPIPEAIEYLVQACEGLAFAHARGVAHRDVKPSNLIVTRRADGSALLKILDFGISKVLEPTNEQELATAVSSVSSILGSLGYMSPEQLRLRPVDERTDVWSLGVVAYELLCGTRPFVGSAPEVCARIVAGSPPRPLTEVRLDVSPELEEAIHRCLRSSPEDRAPDVASLARDLLVAIEAPDALERSARIASVLATRASLRES